MLFNSIDFAIFLPIVFFLYWFVANKKLRIQNFLVVVSSYIFYGWWDWRFLSLIFFSTVIDFFVGLKLESNKNETTRKYLLLLSLFVNLGFLCYFKYYNFFLENFISAFSFFGNKISANSLNIILPVGISFYTFQTLSYSIDIYKRKLKPTKDFIAFSAFVSFFPQLVAGPIERATNLLPQFYNQRRFDYRNAVDGMRQILWGLVKKIVVADNCAEYVNEIFSNFSNYDSSELVLGVILFSFQIYGDFSGYSDIAIGTARLFGFNLMRNFAFPYFSRDIAEFWRRWHISLSTWFRDYLYIPLGGSKGNLWGKIRNTIIIFVVSGFWHGANWTFIAWGSLNAFYFLPLMLTENNRKNVEIVAKGEYFPGIKDFLSILITFTLVSFSWIFFRSESMNHAFNYINSIFKQPESYIALKFYWRYKRIFIIIALFTFFEWFGRSGNHALDKIRLSKVPRWSLYIAMGVLIVALGNFNKTEFIYFAF